MSVGNKFFAEPLKRRRTRFERLFTESTPYGTSANDAGSHRDRDVCFTDGWSKLESWRPGYPVCRAPP